MFGWTKDSYLVRTKEESFDQITKRITETILLNILEDKRPKECSLLPTVLEKFTCYRGWESLGNFENNLRNLKKCGAVHCKSYYLILNLAERVGLKIKHRSNEAKKRMIDLGRKIDLLRQKYDIRGLLQDLNLRLSIKCEEKIVKIKDELINDIMLGNFNAEYKNNFGRSAQTPCNKGDWCDCGLCGKKVAAPDTKKVKEEKLKKEVLAKVSPPATKATSSVPLERENKIKKEEVKDKTIKKEGGENKKVEQGPLLKGQVNINKKLVAEVSELEKDIILHVDTMLYAPIPYQEREILYTKLKGFSLKWVSLIKQMYNGVPLRTSLLNLARKLGHENLNDFYSVFERLGLGKFTFVDNENKFKFRIGPSWDS